ncbi:hypothetical protein G114_11070 [Aeromonas diversa CDC 2478-85]|uniref:Uncharacterized protein n=1 Tax=Aeromonas diversa CDC 2478-85 TaxID=1268237 RepID=N9VJP8_9GAMM|nr:hypothetical protein [Aeromonas diversa]ENY71843.1 hypothetical protein G114_11070 [Aeromonas diversa CDC 2478-85]
MKTFIYYPGMEVRDELWLKFALLWLERLAFVFTVSEKSDLQGVLTRVEAHSDLLAPSPDAAFFERVTPAAIAQLEGLLAPDFVRHKVFGNRELIARWRDSRNHDCFCPDQAGLTSLHHFCLERGFASQTQGGILMARRLANLLSMRLARDWALANEGILITEHDYLDRLLHLMESRYHNRGGQDCFLLEIALPVPRDLATLPLDELLTLRTRQGFRAALGEFHRALEALLIMLDSGYADMAILGNFLGTHQTLSAVMGPDALSVPLCLSVSTRLPAMPMIHSLKGYAGPAQASLASLTFQPIKKSHFHHHKSRHGFTLLGNLRQLKS